MDEKEHWVHLLRDEFDRWEALLGGMSEAEIVSPRLPGGWSIKDVVAHLWAWQQRSIARMEAALENREPQFPGWPDKTDLEDATEQINTWIYETNKDKPWQQVYREWRQGFQRFLELCELVDEPEMIDPGEYAWLDGQPLVLVLDGSYDHHHREHYEPLVEFLKESDKR